MSEINWDRIWELEEELEKFYDKVAGTTGWEREQFESRIHEIMRQTSRIKQGREYDLF